MKLTFDVKNDFESTYYLPGYGCKAVVSVKDGIVQLNIVDDFDEDEDYEDEYDVMDDDLYDDDMELADKKPDSEDYTDNDMYRVDAEHKESPSDAEIFIKKLAKVDTDGVIMGMLAELVKNKKITDMTSKANRTFRNILNNLAEIIKDNE